MKPYYKTDNGQLFCFDNVKYLNTVNDNTFDLTVTSPPYDNLRDYKGYSWDFEALAKELYRTTKVGGVVVWVVGDATINGSETGSSFKQALYFMDCGFNLHDTMIYQKPNAPLSHNRYEQEFEYMFVLSKGKPKTFNGIKDRKNAYSGSKVGGSKRDVGSGILRKSSGIKKGKIIQSYGLRYNIWRVPNKIKINHPAPFPEQLAYDHIISWSNENDLIFDPFMGSGTTAKMCEKSNRKWIGCEISEEYCEIIKHRIETEVNQLKLEF